MRRLLLLLLVPLLVLAGCGDDAADDDVAADIDPTTTTTTSTTEAPVPDEDDVRVEVSFGEPLRLGEVTWVVTVTNEADDPLELAFPDGQRADVLLRDGGETIYQWSLAQMFTQQLGKETVPPGGELSFELTDLLEVDPGEYELEALVTASDGSALRTSRTVTVHPR